jgi:type I restriction enzyme M protein
VTIDKDSGENIVNSTDKDLLDYIRQLKPTKCIINPPYENKNPILFTKQAIEYLEPNGKLIIIMPTPTLTKNQKENGLTHEILKMAKLDFVIKMPMNIFSEQKRTVNTSIFGFTKTPHDNDDEVLFYHLKEDGLVSIQHKGRVDKFNKWNDIESQIINSINNSKEIDGVCEKRKIYKDNILVASGVQNTKNSHHKLVKISDLFKIETGSLASDDSEDGEYDFITASSEWKKHSDFTHDCKAIIYAVKAAGSLGRTHYVNGKFIASNLCLILTPKSDKYPVNLEFYGNTPIFN